MKAVVYISAAGHTEEYARILGQKTGLPVYSLKEATKKLEKNAPIVYLGWLFANSIKGYQKAAGQFHISAICAVGLCDTGTAIDQVRQVNSLADSIPLFTMQGGMDKTKLHGIHKLMIGMLIKGLSSQKERSEQDEHMLALLTHDKSYVSEENTDAFMEWYASQT